EPDLAHRARDRFVVQRAAALEVAERALQLVREGVEHRPPSVLAGRRGSSNAIGRRFAPGRRWRDTRFMTGVTAARKTVTVLFCDLVDSTGLGETLDPESLRD